MGFHETAAAVMFGNILAASVILTVVKHWNSKDEEWSWWAMGAVVGPIIYFLAGLLIAVGPPPFLGG